MSRLPLVVGFGGVNAAGRTSHHYGYRRMILDALPSAAQQQTLLSIGTLTGQIQYQNGAYQTSDGAALNPQQLPQDLQDQLKNDTLLRKITSELFDTDAMLFQRRAKISNPGQDITFNLRQRDLPNTIPANWRIQDLGDNNIRVTVSGETEVLFPDTVASKVKTAGQLPSGFTPGKLYQSRNHPRGLQMTVFGASDALQSMGISIDTIKQAIGPDQMAVYASSGMNQLDDFGYGGMLKAAALGKRTTSKQCPLGFGEMTADFINAYILGSVGSTGGMMGACASFLYNLQHAVQDIQSGKRRMALVGTAEAPITPEIIEGYRAMGALAEDDDLLSLDPGRSTPDYRKPCRPFGNNCGFTLGESAQFVILMDDELALELGAQIYAAVPDVFVHADGFKKSIAAPGVGNYLTLAKATSLTQKLLGESALQQRSYIHAHGTGTPQNRVTESHVLNEVAKAFGIQNWPVAAIKSYLGHSIGSAGGDQTAAALGTWAEGFIPGIHTLDQIAEDVNHSNLSLQQNHTEVGSQGMDASLLNSKGFGGNNATALLLAPHVAQTMLAQKHGQAAMTQFQHRQQAVIENSLAYGETALNGTARPIYHFGEGVLAGEDLTISDKGIRVPGFGLDVTYEDTHACDEFSLAD